MSNDFFPSPCDAYDKVEEWGWEGEKKKTSGAGSLKNWLAIFFLAIVSKFRRFCDLQIWRAALGLCALKLLQLTFATRLRGARPNLPHHDVAGESDPHIHARLTASVETFFSTLSCH